MIINNKIKRRKSSQREKIYKLITKNSSHPTALDIYDVLRKKTPYVSLGNVYRNIKILMEEGRIGYSEFGDGIEHFDAVTEPHYHFICEHCQKISDFFLPIQNNIIQKAQKKTNHIISGHTIQFYGICQECKTKLKILKKGENNER